MVEHQLPKLRVVGSSPIARFEKGTHTRAFAFSSGDVELTLLMDC